MNDIQNTILSIFKEVAKICDENGIPYYAIGGTCLGAVRHHGFIPWDDDIDIAIPIEYFDDFLLILKKQLPEGLELWAGTEKRYYAHLFVKVINSNTTFIEDVIIDRTEAYMGVFVDIMPISGIPKSALQRKIFNLKISIYKVCDALLRFNDSLPKKEWKKIIWFILQMFEKKIPYHYFSDKWLGLLKKYPFYESENVGYVWERIKKKYIFERKWFDNTVDISFEDTIMKCPGNWDAVLTRFFGDYMKLPPVEQRVTVHSGIVDLNQSYKIYQNNSELCKK